MKCFPRRIVRSRRRGVSIFTKVLLAFLLLAIVLIALTSGFFELLLRQYIFWTQSQQLAQKAAYISTLLSSQSDSISITYERVREIESLTEAKVIYIDANLVARLLPIHQEEAPQFELRQIIDTLDKELVLTLLSGQSVTDVRDVEFLNAKVLFAGAPLFVRGNVLSGAILLCRPLHIISSSAGNAAYVMMLSCLTAGVVSVFLVLLLSRYLTKPLRLINRTACRMAEGCYDERVELHQQDEIGQLGNTLNLLASRLSLVIDDLRNEKCKLEQMIDGIGEGIIALEQDGKIVHHNAAALELLEMRKLPQRLAEAQDARLTELMRCLNECLETGDKVQVDWKNDSERAITVNIWPLLNQKRQPIAAVALLRDNSETQRLEQLRREYIANVSHELRTPLTGIRGMVEPLLDGIMETEDERQDCYRVIYQETLRLQKLITEMLSMSRLQDGNVTIEVEPLQVPGILQAAVRRLADRAQENGVTLSVEIEEDALPAALGSEDHILQVLIIFLDNALSFTPPGGSITLYAHACRDRKMCIGVRDTGSGIDPKDLPYIWERFYKADKSRLHTAGTGLGLSIAKLTVEHMNGQVRAFSQPEAGATFEFLLPLADVT